MTETHKGYKVDERNSIGKDCWGCGHWLIGGGCWKNGQMSEVGWRNTGPNDSCEEWVKEGAHGTITGDMQEAAEEFETEQKEQLDSTQNGVYEITKIIAESKERK